MSKGKYKRKKEHAEKHKQQQTMHVASLSGSVNPKTETEDGAEGKTQTSSKKDHPMRLGETIKAAFKRSNITDWLIAIFTGALVATSVYQFIVMGSQLDTMRKDQRPWIKLTFESDAMKELGEVGGTVHLVNKGKTPAKSISADLVIERIKNGEEPKLDYPLPHVRVSQGILFPEEVMTAHVSRLRTPANNEHGAEPDPLTKSEFEDLIATRIFFVVYGTIHYKDFFGIDRWTKFCGFASVASTPNSTVTARRCSDYSDVDSN